MRTQPRTSFEWSIYVDATLAGLAALIPIPFLDDVFEAYFRRRMPERIARANGRTLSPAVLGVLRSDEQSCLSGCLSLPLTLTIGLLQRLSRKLLYVLTVKQATDQLSDYWHRAFLLDYGIAAGHFETPQSARIACLAMEQVLETTQEPVVQLAQQVVAGPRHVWRILRRARRGREDPELQQARAEMGRRWNRLSGYLRTVAQQYDQAYQQYQQHLAVQAPGQTYERR